MADQEPSSLTAWTRGSGAADAGRALLDHFGVRPRLEEVRDGLWQGGRLTFRAEPSEGRPPRAVFYALDAAWDRAAFEPAPGPEDSGALVSTRGGTVVGRWRRTTGGYDLHVGIHADAPNLLFVHSRLLRTVVPFLGRSDADVGRALERTFAGYRELFLERGWRTVPEATAAEARRLRDRGL